MGPVSKVLGALNLISRVNFAAIERGLSSGLMPFLGVAHRSLIL